MTRFKQLIENKEKIIYQYNNGISTVKLSKQYNCSSQTITRFLQKNLIQTRNNTPSFKYSVDKNYFKQINTEDKAYIFGLWSADGFLYKEKTGSYRIGIELKEEDFEILQKIKNKIQYTGPILFRSANNRGNRNNHNHYSLKISNKNLFLDLEKHGCHQRKSKTLLFPKNDIINEDLIYAYLRGYFDGDGSISKKQSGTFRLHFTSSIYFIDGLNIFLKQNLNIKPYLYQPLNKTYKDLHIEKQEDVKTFLNYIYQNISNTSLYLNRKYQKYLSFTTIYNEKYVSKNFSVGSYTK